jgi:hypothetical protein
MNASELTFGIEIETVAPDSAVRLHGLVIGGYHCGIQVPYLPAGWKAEADSSIDNSAGGHKCEIISPVLKGIDGLRQVIEVAQTLTNYGHRVNASCGVHVHVGWLRSTSSIALARLITMVSYVEKGLYAITGTKSREAGRYSKKISTYGNDKAAKTILDRDRMHVLNLTNLVYGSKETVEFRVFSASLNEVKLVGWVQVCLGLVERALNGKRMPLWNPKPLTGGWKKAGEGASETERLMGFLAWGKGYAKQHKGQVYGWIYNCESSVPALRVSMDSVKSMFRRLAKKYDGQI